MNTHRPGLHTNPATNRRTRLPNLATPTNQPPAPPTDEYHTSTRLKNGKHKQSLYLPVSTINEMRNAAAALAATPGAPRGISELADNALQYYIEFLQDTYNGGKRFPQRDRELPRGPYPR